MYFQQTYLHLESIKLTRVIKTNVLSTQMASSVQNCTWHKLLNGKKKRTEVSARLILSFISAQALRLLHLIEIIIMYLYR